MKVMSIVGARPNFMKVAPIITAIRAHNARVTPPGALESRKGSPEAVDHVLVHTGQHYDRAMSDSFFADLGLPEPDYNLGVGSGSHAAQTAEVMRKFEEVLLREQPDVLIVVGDVNSTLACALVAAKISFDASGRRPLIAHVEAGLRSFDRTMPEETNRVLTDQLSDLLFTTEESARKNLMREGVPAERVHFVGNTMIDSLLAYKEKAETSHILDDLGLSGGPSRSSASPASRYALLTLHRPANVDDRAVFLNILEGLEDLLGECQVIFPAHPRTQKRIKEFGIDHRFEWNGIARGAITTDPGIRITQPLGYLDFLCLMANAALVITDSGGIQEETTCLGVPCITVRANTERPVTVDVGTNLLAGLDPDGIRAAIRQQLASRGRGSIPEKWDGQAAGRILDVLRNCTGGAGAPLSPSETLLSA
jgi:UDP-N-acetylglucosamine 2-epimerase (non-hydrolysing)